MKLKPYKICNLVSLDSNLLTIIIHDQGCTYIVKHKPNGLVTHVYEKNEIQIEKNSLRTPGSIMRGVVRPEDLFNLQ